MTCNCQADIEARLLDQFKTQAPTAINHSARMTGYTFVVGTRLVAKGFMPVELRAAHPMKKCGVKAKTDHMSMVFTYCPFCGKKYDEAKAEQGAEVPA